MACCLTAPSHYLNQCWLIISKVQRHSSEGNFAIDTPALNHWNYLGNYLSKISFKSHRGHWVNVFVLTKISVVILANICVPTVFLVCNSRCKIHYSIDIYNLHYIPPPFTNHQVCGGGAVGGGGGAYGGWGRWWGGWGVGVVGGGDLLCGPFWAQIP